MNQTSYCLFHFHKNNIRKTGSVNFARTCIKERTLHKIMNRVYFIQTRIILASIDSRTKANNIYKFARFRMDYDVFIHSFYPVTQ